GDTERRTGARTGVAWRDASGGIDGLDPPLPPATIRPTTVAPATRTPAAARRGTTPRSRLPRDRGATRRDRTGRLITAGSWSSSSARPLDSDQGARASNRFSLRGEFPIDPRSCSNV